LVTIIGHSNLFYWWPVWAAGFLMALLSFLDGYSMAIVPTGTVAEKARQVQGVDGSRDVLIAPADPRANLANDHFRRPHGSPGGSLLQDPT
jgi:hypothetical protein